jgi:hypothetical protein
MQAHRAAHGRRGRVQRSNLRLGKARKEGCHLGLQALQPRCHGALLVCHQSVDLRLLGNKVLLLRV